jgi:Glyoxalase-like domain
MLQHLRYQQPSKMFAFLIRQPSAIECLGDPVFVARSSENPSDGCQLILRQTSTRSRFRHQTGPYLRGGPDARSGAGRDAAGDRPQRLASVVVDGDVSNVRQKRLPGVPRTHLASLWFRIPCGEPEAVARFWGVILGSEPEDIEGKGSWFIGANIGKTGASFDFYPAPEKMTDLSRLHLDVFTEDVEGTARLAVERGGKAENELRNNAGRLLWRRVVDMEGNEAVLFQVDDLNAWWGQDNEGKPWPPAGTSPHIYIEEE